MLRASDAETYAVPRNWRFRLVVLLVKIWLRKARLRLTLPDAVRLNRLAAPRFVFILGM